MASGYLQKSISTVKINRVRHSTRFFLLQCRNRQPINRRTNPCPTPSHLPPLSKGGGLTAKHKLLLCCVLIAYPRPFYHQTFLPSRRRDCYIPSPHTNPSKPALSHPLFVGERACSSRCTEYCHSHNNCKKTIIPQKSPSHLPPLSKVRCCRPKKFGRLPEGLSHLPYPFRFSDTSVNNLSFRTQLSQNRTIPRKPPTPLPLNERFASFAFELSHPLFVG